MNKKQYLYSNLFAWGLVLFLITNYIFGWTIPSQDPPGGNVVLETGATPAGSTGYIQFNDNGNLGADSNLFWDNTNKYLGIGTMSPGAKLDLNLSSGIGFQVKYIGVSSGAYKKSVILLHEIYDDTAIGGNNVVGKIFASRGSAGAFNRKSFADVVSGSAYTNTFATVQSTGEEWILKTCYYNGKKYIALDVPFNNAQYSEGFFFEGFYKSTGESLLLVDYYCTNTDSCGGPVLNSEINNSLTDYTEKRNLWFSGNIIASTPTADNHVATKAYVDSSGIPSGMVAMFTGSCPTGWTRFSALDGKFARGASSYGATGGSETHSHSTNYSTQKYSSGTYYAGAVRSGTLSVYSSSHLPPYLDVIWCQKN